MASIDVGDDNLSLMSESSDLQRARKMYEDLQAMSMESAAGSQEVISISLTQISQIFFFFCSGYARSGCVCS